VFENEVHTSVYHAVGSDITNLAAMDKMVESTALDTSLPTLFISECVLVYLPPEKGTSVIKWASERFSTAGFVSYDPILPFDAFGKVMVRNLQEKGCALLSITQFHDIPSQKQRYLDQGWQRVETLDMNDLYNRFLPHFIPPEEIARIERIEGLDELEEWVLIQAHYVYILAMKDDHSHATSDLYNNNNNGAAFWDGLEFESLAKTKRPPSDSFI